MLTALFWKKVWTWLKHYWYWPVIIVLLVFSTVTSSRAKEQAFDLLLKQKENYKKEIEIIEKSNKEKSLEKDNIVKDHVEELDRLEKDHDLKIEELEQEKREELVRVIEQNKDKPEELAEEISKILSVEFFRKNR
jgi:hypothetical protein